MKVIVHSYKKAQQFKKDYVRMSGSFLKFDKDTANHKSVEFTIDEGAEFDARGSRYREGLTRWDATKAQSWAKFRAENGKLLAFDFNGESKPLPGWVEVLA